MDKTRQMINASAWGEISITTPDGKVLKSNKDWAICPEHGALETLLEKHTGKSLTVKLTIKPATKAADKVDVDKVDISSLFVD